MFVRSFETKAAARISRKPFELELPNFMGPPILTLSADLPDMTSLSTSGRKLYWENSRIYRLRRLRVEFLENYSIQDHEILQPFRGQAVPQTCQKWRQQLIPVGCKMLLNTTEKCEKRVEKQKKTCKSEMVRYTAKDKCNAASNAFSILSS